MTRCTDIFLLVIAGLLPGSAIADICHLDRADETTVITYVHDGDTVYTGKNRKIRLIGLDTPELATEFKSAEPLAEEALDSVKKLLASSTQVKLRFDAQRQDRYQRDLAHLFLSNGDNITARILERGLAVALIMPPNLLYADCYLAAQNRARRQKLGIWRLPEFQPTALADLDTTILPVYRLVNATVTGLQRNRRDYQIKLQDGEQQLTLFIKGHQRALFNQVFNRQLTGQKVLVQGWINERHGRLQMNLLHPGFITIVADE